MPNMKREKRIVIILLAINAFSCLLISMTATFFFSDQWPRLVGQTPIGGFSIATFLSIHAGSLIIFAILLSLCATKLQFGNRWKLWEPQLARWITLTTCGILCLSPFMFPIAIPAFYYLSKLSEDDFE
jgi:hypothetical protein